MADSSNGSIWQWVGPAVQAGATGIGAVSGANTAAGGYSQAGNTIRGAIDTSNAGLTPYVNQGSAAGSALLNLYGLGGKKPDYSAFENSPGLKFQEEMGDQAIQRAANAQGSGFSTTTLAGLAKYNQGIAQQSYQDYVRNLFGLTQLGANAASARGSQAITGATAIGQAQIGGADARASGVQGAAGAIAGLAGKLPWQQIGGALSSWANGGNGGGGGGGSAGGGNPYASDPNYNGNTLYVPGAGQGGNAGWMSTNDPVVSSDAGGTTTYYGDDSNP